jgi:hypothetical protein
MTLPPQPAFAALAEARRAGAGGIRCRRKAPRGRARTKPVYGLSHPKSRQIFELALLVIDSGKVLHNKGYS